MTSMTARGVGPRPVLATRYEDSNGIGDRAIPPLTHVFAPSGRHTRTLRAKMVAPVRAVSESKVSQEALVTSLPLSMATMLLSCAPSYAEEAVAEATKEAADIMSENSGVLGYTNGGLVVAFSPLVIYGGEYRRVSKSIEEQVAQTRRSPARSPARLFASVLSVPRDHQSQGKSSGSTVRGGVLRGGGRHPVDHRVPSSNLLMSIDQHIVILPRSCRSSLARPCSPAHARRGPARRATSS